MKQRRKREHREPAYPLGTALDVVASAVDARLAAEAAFNKAQASAADAFYAARTHLKMTQERMAKALDVHHTYLSKVEQGKTVPGLETMQRLAAVIRKSGKLKG